MLVNTVEGLRATNMMQRDLMRTYAAGYWQTLLKLRLPAAMPFVFNGLKVTTTLALIGAIVAEFFRLTHQGHGISYLDRGRKIGAGYGLGRRSPSPPLQDQRFNGSVAMIEKKVTFWHPSQRG